MGRLIPVCSIAAVTLILATIAAAQATSVSGQIIAPDGTPEGLRFRITLITCSFVMCAYHCVIKMEGYDWRVSSQFRISGELFTASCGRRTLARPSSHATGRRPRGIGEP